MREVYLKGRRIRLDPSTILGEGGEAEVYDISSFEPGTVLKLWKPPTHPSFEGQDEEARRNRAGAALRLAEQQRKLKAFPRDLPPRVVQPIDLALNKSGDQIVGYSMRLLSGAEALRRYAELPFRRDRGITNAEVLAIFKDLYGTLGALHQRQVVVGDFNYYNVMVTGLEAYQIDADSMQFGGFPCRTFTTRFVDPLICDPALRALVQTRPHSEATDWYAFALMLFESLLLVHPYGGIYSPRDVNQQAGLALRPLKRISVLHPEVKLPGVALPLESLPDELLHYYAELLHKDRRGILPHKLLESLRWTRCTVCGTEHARLRCPKCSERATAAAIVEVVRGRAAIKRLFRTSGRILAAAVQEGELRYLYHEGGDFKREDRSAVLSGEPAAAMRYRISGSKTALALQSSLAVIDPKRGATPTRTSIDTFRGTMPVIESNSKHLYWMRGGNLERDGELGSKLLGTALSGQTRIWAGERFGFGYYRAGAIQSGFIFDAEKTGINDSVALPALRGELLDAAASLSLERCWFFTRARQGGDVVSRLSLIDRLGAVIDTLEAKDTEDSWLNEVGGRCTATFKGLGGSVHALFVVNGDELIRIDEREGRITVGARFPDTKGLIASDEELLMGREGLFVVNRREIRLLTLS
ncbi:MAG: hypothetical protein K1X83_08720 [Oligoflexia bacterium]|nr:hypothetical protein [Oligoflexia bacterium]